MLPRRGPFPVRGHFWDTPGQNIAIVRHPGTHNVNISPPPDAWECISRAPCRRRTAESALRAHVVMRRSPGNALRGHVLPCPTARWRTAAAYRQQSHPSAAQGAVCSFPPYPARAHPRDAAVPSCGGGRRRDERAGTLARAVRWVWRRIDVRPTWGAGAIGCWLATRRSVGHGSGAGPTRTRACGCNSGAHTHRRAVRPPDAPELLQVCTASGRSRQLRAHRPLSAGAFGHGPSRARGNAVGCGRYRLQGQLRCKSTNEPVHSNIFPLRY